MSIDDERTAATAIADPGVHEHVEAHEDEVPAGWFFDLSDEARRKEADLTRDLRRALLEEYRLRDRKAKRKKFFGLLPRGGDDGEEPEPANVPVFVPRPAALLDESIESLLPDVDDDAEHPPVAIRGVPRPFPGPRAVQRERLERATEAHRWTEPFEDLGLEMPARDEPEPPVPEPARAPAPRPASLPGTDDWTTSVDARTISGFLHPSQTPWTAAPLPAREPERAPMARVEDDWSTEASAFLLALNLAPRATAAAAPAASPPAQAAAPEPIERSLPAYLLDDAEEPEQPAPRAAVPSPRGPAPRRPAAAPQTDDWTSEAGVAVRALSPGPAPVRNRVDFLAEMDDAPAAPFVSRAATPAPEPAGEKSRWDEMLDASRNQTGSIVDAMREIWAQDAADGDAKPPRRRSRMLAADPAAPESPDEPALDAEALASADGAETTGFVGKLGGMFKRRHDDAPDEDADGAADAFLDSDTEIPETLWRELFGEPGDRPAALGGTPDPAGGSLRRASEMLAATPRIEQFNLDDDISLAEIFGEEATEAVGRAAAVVPEDAGPNDLPPLQPLWVDDDDEPATATGSAESFPAAEQTWLEPPPEPDTPDTTDHTPPFAATAHEGTPRDSIEAISWPGLDAFDGGLGQARDLAPPAPLDEGPAAEEPIEANGEIDSRADAPEASAQVEEPPAASGEHTAGIRSIPRRAGSEGSGFKGLKPIEPGPPAVAGDDDEPAW